MTDFQRVDVGGILIAYEKSGAGPPLVLVHGGEADRRSYHDLMPLLAERFTVITYDQRDTGDTVSPAEPYSVADLGRDLGDLIAALGYEKAHVFGTSYGGMIAQNAALERPSRIDRLVLSATVAGKPGNVPMSPAALQLMQSPDPAAKEELMKLFFSKKNREPQNWPTVSAAIKTRRPTRSPEAHARRMKAGMQHDTHARLSEIVCPTVVVAGAEDEIIQPENSHYLAAHIPQATLRILPDAGHVWMIEHPALFAQLLREFLLS